MPLYDYACTQCGSVTEVRHGFDESHEGVCARCGGPLKRVFSAAPILFKGPGFYLTDSRKAGAGSSEPAKPAETPAASSGPSESAPSKPSTESAA
ncbi:MAG TPA: FmdB family zinc ribbon protein [Verrucomicrobiae bacterium]|nr:FmdB family zinc ribbon protein [Verrucomicrobiae bacterium]